MATHCPNGHEIAEGGRFCPVCGVPLAPGSDSESKPVPSAAAAPTSAPAPAPTQGTQRGGGGPPRASWSRRVLGALWHDRGWKGRTALLGVAALTALAVLGAALGENDSSTNSSAAEPTTEETTKVVVESKPKKVTALSATGYRQLFKPGQTTVKAAKSACPQYRRLLVAWENRGQKYLADSEGKTADAYEAAEYVSHSSWVHKDYRPSFDKAVSAISRARLRVATRGATKRPAFVTAFQKDALHVCGLRQSYNKTSAVVSRLDVRSADLVGTAKAKPWYPREYNGWLEDDNVAWRWSSGTCDNSYWACWGMQVISKNGCDSLYVELQIQDSAGNAVDWTNDTVSYLAAGQTALLDFSNTNESGGTAQLVEMNCY